jgi:hypothetical protein
MSDPILTNTVTNQKAFVTSLSSVVEKLGILVKVGDEIAKVCPPLCSHVCTAKIIADPSICQFCMASALRGIKGESNSITFVFLACESAFNRWSKRNKT